MKKIVSLISAIILLMSTYVFLPTANAESVSDTQIKDFLGRLNINTANAGEGVTRVEFATMIMQAVNLYNQTVAMEESVFEDVGGIAVSVVNPAVALGYFKLPDDRIFRGDDYITYQEAAAVAVRVLGYEALVKNTGSAAQYVGVALRYDVLDGVKAEPFDGEEVNKLIFNMLHAKRAKVKYETANGVLTESYRDGEITLLEDIFGIARYKGTVKAVNGVSVLGEASVSDCFVTIDGATYETDETYPADKFLNCSVNYYVTDMDGVDWLFAMYERKSDTVMFYGDEVERVSADLTEIEYYDGSQNVTLEIAKTATFVYNGTQQINISAKDMKNKNAAITLFDGNGDDVYETVTIENPEYYRVALVDTTEEVIEGENGELPIRLSEYKDSLITVVNDDGSSAALDAIQSGGVIEVQYTKTSANEIDYSKAIKITILNKSYTGTVEEVNSDYVVIDGEMYEYIDSAANGLRAGRGVTFYIGTCGRIVDARLGSEANAMYGYFVAASGEGGLSERLWLKIFNQQGEMKAYETTDKISYTGYLGGEYVERKNLTSTEFLSLKLSAQLVLFKTDEEEKVTSVSFAYDHSAEDDYIGYDEERFSLDEHMENGSMFNLVASKNYFYDNNSYVFAIPKNGDDKKYRVERYSYYSDSDGLVINLYDAKRDMTVGAGVMYLSGGNAGATALDAEKEGDAYAAVISKKYLFYDEEEGISRTGYIAYYQGKEIRLFSTDEDLCDSKVNVPAQGEKSPIYFSELNPGDVIQLTQNSEGEVNLMNVLHRHNINDMRASSYCNENLSSAYLSLMTTEFGKVTDYVSDGYFTLEKDKNRKYSLADKRLPAYVYIYDMDTQKVQVQKTLPHLDTSDYVFVKTRRTSVRDMVVYRQR